MGRALRAVELHAERRWSDAAHTDANAIQLAGKATVTGDMTLGAAGSAYEIKRTAGTGAGTLTTITGQAGASGQNGGGVTIYGGTPAAGSANGGDVIIKAGSAGAGGGTGGNVILQNGAGTEHLFWAKSNYAV